jgi:hypothetical protein
MSFATGVDKIVLTRCVQHLVFGALGLKPPVRESVDLDSPSAAGAEYHLELSCFQLLLQAGHLSKLLFFQLHPQFGGSLYRWKN